MLYVITRKGAHVTSGAVPCGCVAARAATAKADATGDGAIPTFYEQPWFERKLADAEAVTSR